MTQWQSVGFDFLTRGVPGAERGFLDLGRAASASSDDVMGLARRLDDVSGKIAKARVELAGDKEALARLDKLSLKMLAVGRKVTGDVSIDGAAKASAEISGLDAELDKLSAKSAKATSAVGLPGLSGVSGMGALIGAGVVLSPIITTIGFGVAGFGAAAAGAIAPVFKAAQAAGGLQKNMAKLDPEQQKVAHGLLDLGKQYRAFEQALQPTVLKDFSGALKIAGHLMHDLEPVSKATGAAIGGLLGAVDKEFQSGTWQDFFGFMAKTAGPDVKLVSSNLVDLMDTLPPLLRDLQPVAESVLTLSDDFLKAAHTGADLIGVIELLPPANTKSADSMSSWAETITNRFIPGARWVNRQLRGVQAAMGDSAAATGKNAASMTKAAPPAWTLAGAIGAVTGALDAQLTPLLTSQGDWVTWKQSQQAAKTAIDAVHGSLNGQSKAALAADQSIITTTTSALAFVDAQKHTKAGLDAADAVLKNQIGFLKDHAGKSRIAKKEIDLLRAAEAKLHDIRQRISVTGTGHWSIATLSPGGPGGVPRPLTPAAGMRVPGFGGGDRWPALLEGGEAVVDKARTAALAPLFKAIGVPGFAAGGVAGSFSGSVPGLTRWLRKEDNATLLAFENAVARATLAGIRAAQAGAGGQTFPGGLGRAGLRWLENLWTGAGGPGAGTAHVAAAIALAESGGNPRAFNPSGASGLWQILGAVDPRDQPFLFSPQVNAHEAVLKYRGAGGFSPWVTFETGAYRQFMDSGGWLAPGWNPPMYNATGRPEHLVPAGQDENLAPLLRQVIAELRKLPGVQAAQLGRVLSGRPVAPRPSVFASR